MYIIYWFFNFLFLELVYRISLEVYVIFVIFKNEIVSWFISKMSLFGKSRGIVIWVKEVMVNYSKFREKKRGVCYYRGKERVGRGCFE